MEVTADWGEFLCAAAVCCKLMRGVWRLQTTGGDNCISILWTSGPAVQRLSAEWIILDCCTPFFYENKGTDGGGWWWCCCTGLVRCQCVWNAVQLTYSDYVCQILAKYTTLWADMAAVLWNTLLAIVCLQAWVPFRCVILCFSCFFGVVKQALAKPYQNNSCCDSGSNHLKYEDAAVCSSPHCLDS